MVASQLQLFNIEEKYRASDKFDRPGTAYDDAVRILNGL